MSVNNKYWEDVAKRLQMEHPEAKSPSNWSRGEAKPWLDRIERKTASKLSYATFRRVFKEGSQGSAETRNIFARYFDYEDHARYMEELSQVNAFGSSASTEEILEPKKKRVWLWILLPFLLLGICWVGKATWEKREKKQILAVVEKAIQYEYVAYTKLPNYQENLPLLESVFWKDSSAHKIVIDILEGNKARNWTLTNDLNPSFVKPYYIKFLSANGKQAFVETKEHWRLEWYDKDLHRYEYSYDVVNKQVYTLEKSENTGEWKILVNTYGGNRERVVPRIIACSELDVSTVELLKVTARAAIEGGNDNLTIRSLICFYDGQDRAFPKVLSLLIAKQNNLNRDLNTDKIVYNDYLIRKETLMKEILNFIEEMTDLLI